MGDPNNQSSVNRIYANQTKNPTFVEKIKNKVVETAKKVGSDVVNKAPDTIMDAIKKENEKFLASKNATPDYAKMLFGLLMGKKGDPKNEDFIKFSKYDIDPNGYSNSTLWKDDEFKKKIFYNFKKLSDKGKEQELKRQILINNGSGFSLPESKRLELCYEYDNTDIKRVNYTNSLESQNKFLDKVRHDVVQGKIGS